MSNIEWTDTPHGTYRSDVHGGTYFHILNDRQGYVLCRCIEGFRGAVTAYFPTVDEAKTAVQEWVNTYR